MAGAAQYVGVDVDIIDLHGVGITRADQDTAASVGADGCAAKIAIVEGDVAVGGHQNNVASSDGHQIRLGHGLRGSCPRADDR